MPHYRKSLGYKFLQETKLELSKLFLSSKGSISPPIVHKNYKGSVYRLVSPKTMSSSLQEVLSLRRSIRRYKDLPIKKEELSALLFGAQGVTRRQGPYLFRTAPSAGALYPIETYLYINRVVDFDPGFYHFVPEKMLLESISQGYMGNKLQEACLGQSMCNNAAVVFIWSAIPRRTMSKYGSRGMRYIFMDVAHICQNLLLSATALGLGACPIGAFLDNKLNALLGLDGEEETVIYLASVGIPDE